MDPSGIETFELKRRGVARAHVSVAGFFFLIGLLKGAGAVIALSLFILILPLLFGLVHRRALSALSIRRRMVAGQYEGRPVAVELLVQNRSPIPFFMPEIEDPFMADPMPAKRAFLSGWLHAWGNMTARYTALAKGPRGEYTVGPSILSLIDPLGLSRTAGVVENTDLLTVYPTVFPIRQMPFEAARARFSLHLKSTTKASQGQDFYGVREYRRGDSMRHIHWRSSARHLRLIVKEFEMPASKNVYLFIDLFERTARGMGHRSATDYSIRIAAAIVTYAIQSSHCVGLYGHGQTAIRMPPAGGVPQLQRIMRMLVAARQVGQTPFDQLLLEHLADIPIDSVVVLIFPTSQVDIGRYAHAISVLKARGVSPVAVLIDDRSFYRVRGEVKDYGQERSVDDVMSGMVSIGLTVYAVNETSDLEEVFRRPLYAC
ncbi:MAG: hypothetical protein A3G34_11195 [Candidatus Lindowbacteria bacterium RIFCSPLOWO2_12_FULL_62_27]|nr:MAG: hypothetical protein A3G34_11195 [Candidatus Lindowbacteria bacterium RIFCSPLOWO2_12_FULL_62_27]OGH63461.1 MAG: hypothetical protein A3I06_06760 [Candidatus Lindowbacteria bacterium RIFCSPLOWO2_02_FULL_62_12]